MNSNNMLKTAFLLAALTGLFLLVGRVLGGNGGMVFAFVLALVMNGGSYWFSDKIALAMAGAREVSYEQEPELHRTVEELAAYAKLPKPRVYIVDTPTANAFATGRDPEHSAVAVTSGIMNILSRDELAGVLAHELGHVKNRDTLITTVVATVAGAIVMIANMAKWAMIFGGFGRSRDDEGNGLGEMAAMLLMLILAPIAAMLIQLAISRSREYGADAAGARIHGNPLSLASALEKLEMSNRAMPMPVNNVTAHLYIVNPLKGGFAGLFSTHPPIAERVERLRKMAYGGVTIG